MYMRPWRVETGREIRLFRTVTGGKIVCLGLRICGLDGEVADDRQPDEHRELRLDLVPFDSLLMDGQYPCMQIVYQA
jgi:hypothetical protein